MAILENWTFHRSLEHGENAGVIIGEIYDDPRFTDGETVRTSLIPEFWAPEGKPAHSAMTLNTYYLLGRNADGSGERLVD